MAKIIIGNVKGKDGRGITKIVKTASMGAVDTYTITYTDSTTSTFTVNNSDSISLQRQIVPSAAVESSATASQAYAAGQYVVVAGILRKVTSSIAKGNTISNSNSAATTVGGELGSLADSASRSIQVKNIPYQNFTVSSSVAKKMQVSWPIDASRVVGVVPRYTCHDYSDRVVVSDWDSEGVTLRAGGDQTISISLSVLYI